MARMRCTVAWIWRLPMLAAMLVIGISATHATVSVTETSNQTQDITGVLDAALQLVLLVFLLGLCAFGSAFGPSMRLAWFAALCQGNEPGQVGRTRFGPDLPELGL